MSNKFSLKQMLEFWLETSEKAILTKPQIRRMLADTASVEAKRDKMMKSDDTNAQAYDGCYPNPRSNESSGSFK